MKIKVKIGQVWAYANEPNIYYKETMENMPETLEEAMEKCHCLIEVCRIKEGRRPEAKILKDEFGWMSQCSKVELSIDSEGFLPENNEHLSYICDNIKKTNTCTKCGFFNEYIEPIAAYTCYKCSCGF